MQLSCTYISVMRQCKKYKTMKHTTKITSKSVEQSGLPTDYKKAISEYIWNFYCRDKALKTIMNLLLEELQYFFQ